MTAQRLRTVAVVLWPLLAVALMVLAGCQPHH